MQGGGPTHVPSNLDVARLQHWIERIDEKVQLLGYLNPKVEQQVEKLEERVTDIEYRLLDSQKLKE